jgi:flap endonuclease-1
MGIKDIYNILSTKHPSVFVEHKISDFSNKIIAIDILTYLYKYIRSVGEEQWINYILLLFYKLQKNNIRIICIFDGRNYPIEKRNEHEKRTTNMIKIEEKYIKIINLKKQFLETDKIELEYYIDKFNNIISKRNKSYISNPNLINEKKLLKKIDEVEIKLKKQCLKVSKKHFDILKEAIKCLNIEYLVADGEAEKLCSYLCSKNIVDAVLSEDSDVLVYGTPVFMFRINLKTDTFTTINIDELLNDMCMTLSEFTDFCILCGCDYNARVKIKSKNDKRDGGIGSVKAYNLIKEYKTLEKINEEKGFDLNSLNYISCRKIFSFSNEKIYHETLNGNYSLEEFLIKWNCTLSINKWKTIGYQDTYVDILTKIENLQLNI